MVTLYRHGTGWLYRVPAGPKSLVVVVIVLGVSLLPSTWPAAATAVAVTVFCYLSAGLRDGMLGMRTLGRQVLAIRWILLVTIVGQLVFLTPELAAANTARVAAAVVVSGLLAMTTRVTDLLNAFERGLRPLARLGVDPSRVALMLTVTLTTIPVLAKLAKEVQMAQRARGARSSFRTFAIPFLVLATKHAFELGDALTARGFR
jgi:biotin transport system permease protein